MTDPNRPNPAETGDAASGGPADPKSRESAAPRDPTAGRVGEAAGVESPGGSSEADPDALDQSVGRGDGDLGGARTRDGAI